MGKELVAADDCRKTAKGRALQISFGSLKIRVAEMRIPSRPSELTFDGFSSIHDRVFRAALLVP